MDEFKGGCAGCLGGCSGRECGGVVNVTGRFGGQDGHSDGCGCARESGAHWTTPWAEVGGLAVIGSQAFGVERYVAFGANSLAIPGSGGASRAWGPDGRGREVLDSDEHGGFVRVYRGTGD